MRTFVENNKLVEAIAPATGAAAITGDYISLKTAHKVTVVAHITQGNAATVKLDILEAKDVSATDAQVLSDTLPIWTNEDCAAGDTLARQTDAADFTTSAALKHKQIVAEIDPAKLSDGFDCIAVRLGASNVANIVSAQYIVETRYPGETPPSVIID